MRLPAVPCARVSSALLCSATFLLVSHAEDQLAFGRYLRSLGLAATRADLGRAAERRLSLWGWSYGGFMAGMIHTDGARNDVYSTLISVAPVTSWRYYDTAYTER